MANQRLLVEGNDDKHVLEHICKQHKIAKLHAKPLNGATELLESFPVQIKNSTEEGDTIGIVIDADASASSRWQSIRESLLSAGYPSVPVQLDPAGMVLDSLEKPPLPRVGVWIMPNNQTPGTLESFLQRLVPQPNPLYDHAVNSVQEISQPPFSRSDELKAIIHTWLAWQKEPGRPFGTAISAQFLNANAPEAVALAYWLRRLFHGG